MPPPPPPPPPPKPCHGVVWAAVQRDGVTLAECGQDEFGGSVLALAKRILAKKPSPGWEYEKSGKLNGLKFHVHEPKCVWTACCVYVAGAIPELQAKGFVEKITLLSEPLRTEPAWRTGGTLAAQDSFAPTLLQRMEQANSCGKVALVSDAVNEVQSIMSNNIELLLDRGQKLDELEEKATYLGKMSQQFHRGARAARRFQMWQQAKFGMATGTAVTVGVAVVTVPPLVAVMGPAGWAVGGTVAVGAGVATGVSMSRK